MKSSENSWIHNMATIYSDGEEFLRYVKGILLLATDDVMPTNERICALSGLLQLRLQYSLEIILLN